MAQYEMNLRDYWMIVRRRRLIIVVATLAVMALSFWLAKQKVQVFQATGHRPAQGDRPVLAAMPVPRTIAVVLPPGPHSRVTSSSNMAAITCRPIPAASASWPFFAAPPISTIDTIT